MSKGSVLILLFYLTNALYADCSRTTRLMVRAKGYEEALWIANFKSTETKIHFTIIEKAEPTAAEKDYLAELRKHGGDGRIITISNKFSDTGKVETLASGVQVTKLPTDNFFAMASKDIFPTLLKENIPLLINPDLEKQYGDVGGAALVLSRSSGDCRGVMQLPAYRVTNKVWRHEFQHVADKTVEFALSAKRLPNLPKSLGFGEIDPKTAEKAFLLGKTDGELRAFHASVLSMFSKKGFQETFLDGNVGTELDEWFTQVVQIPVYAAIKARYSLLLNPKDPRTIILVARIPAGIGVGGTVVVLGLSRLGGDDLGDDSDEKLKPGDEFTNPDKLTLWPFPPEWYLDENGKLDLKKRIRQPMDIAPNSTLKVVSASKRTDGKGVEYRVEWEGKTWWIAGEDLQNIVKKK